MALTLKLKVNFQHFLLTSASRSHGIGRNCTRWIGVTAPVLNLNDSPIKNYSERVESGELRNDDYQRQVIQQLDVLHRQVDSYVPIPPKPKGFFTKLFGTSSAQTAKQKDQAKKYSSSPKGLYLYGSVGCGKTMLMDLFHDTCHAHKKRRVHFHQFMLEVHRRIHEQKKKMVPEGYILNRAKQAYDPIPPVARDIADHTWLLCFDEFQVTDIADAMILKRLFSYLWKYGVIIIATSNRNPDDLYKNGLQRINFLPFIPMLKANCGVVSLDSGIDYRRQTLPAEGKVMFVSDEDDVAYEMDRIYEDLVSREVGMEGPRTLTVLGRQVQFAKARGRVLDCKFPEICMRPLGAVDYLELCNEFDTILVRDVPRMDLERRTEARRFITLIDTLYDHKIRVACSLAVPVDHLFAISGPSEYDRHHARVLAGDLFIQKGDPNETASLFTGEEELFAFERVMSRLTEMQTEEYWNQREAIHHQERKGTVPKSKMAKKS